MFRFEFEDLIALDFKLLINVVALRAYLRLVLKIECAQRDSDSDGLKQIAERNCLI